MAPAFRELMGALANELSDWASAADALEDAVADLADARSLSSKQVEAVQSLDSLSQHLHQLSQLFRDLGSGSGVRDTDAAADIGRAVARLNLGGLGARLAASPHSARDVAPGEVDLW